MIECDAVKALVRERSGLLHWGHRNANRVDLRGSVLGVGGARSGLSPSLYQGRRFQGQIPIRRLALEQAIETRFELRDDFCRDVFRKRNVTADRVLLFGLVATSMLLWAGAGTVHTFGARAWQRTRRLRDTVH